MRILWISDAIDLNTGFATQSFTIVKGLQQLGHEVITAGWKADIEKKHKDIPIYPLYDSFSNSVSLILNRYYAFDPDVIISYADIHYVQHMILDIRDQRFKERWIHWLPVDGDPYPQNHDSIFQDIRTLVVASKFGEKVFKDNYKGNFHTIYNGIDPEAFHPLDNLERYTQPDQFKDKFVCLFVGVNQQRKKIPFLLEAFAKFAQDKEDALLVLHTQPKPARPSFHGWDIQYLLQQYGLENKAVISNDQVSKAKLNKLYNFATVLVSATGGEGFNLPAVEAMMAGLPLVLPNYTTGAEFIGQEDRCGELIDIAEYTYEGPLNIRKCVVDTEDFAKKLTYLYADWKAGGHTLRKLKESAIARSKVFESPTIVKQWDNLIKATHKSNQLKNIEIVKRTREHRKVLFIDDLPPDQWIGGTQLSTQKIMDEAKNYGIEAECLSLDQCSLADLHSADKVILNNIHETVKRSAGLISEIVSTIPFIKWEHDFNFCQTRDFRCFGDVKSCQTECLTKKYAEIYANAQSIVFQSPLHHQAFVKYFGPKAIQNSIILPPPIVPEPFLQAAKETKREQRYLFTGLLHPFRGIEELIQFARENPHKKFLIHTAYNPTSQAYVKEIEELPNVELRIEPIPYDQMPQLYASCSDFYYKPRYIDASSRSTLEAMLSGCRLRVNENVGFMKYDWDWTDHAKISETVTNAPKLFWDHVSTFLDKKSTVTKSLSRTNIVFFPSGGDTGDIHLPSSHIRVYRVSEELKKMGYGIQVVDPDLPDEMKFGVLSSLKANDIIYVQKTYTKYTRFNHEANFKQLKGKNVIVYDVDDYYPERNQEGKIQYMYQSDRMAMLSDLVIVGSHRLADRNRKNNKNIRIIASLVDDNLYKYVAREEREPRSIKILWTEKDGAVYLNDILLIKDVLDEMHQKYGCQLILQAFNKEEIPHVQELFPYARILPLVRFAEYKSERIPLMHDCDFFIAPFDPKDERSLEKQHKAGQNSRHKMAMGIPGVASPTAEHDYFIEDGVNGFLARTPEEWREKIEKMITDSALRIQMGFKSRETIEKNYTIDKTIRSLLEAINTVKYKYYNPAIEVISSSPEYRAVVTIKDLSSGGGTMTSTHIRDILENVGYKTDLVYCDRIRGNKIQSVMQVNGQRLKKPMFLREFMDKSRPDVIFFDDVARFESESAQFADKVFLILCGCANVHEEYFTSPLLLSGAPNIDKVFVKNYSLYKYLNSLFGHKFAYWQGGIDGVQMRNQYGRAVYRHPSDGVLLTSSFSKGWWKNPTMAALAAFGVWKKYPKTKYFKPVLRAEDVEFSKNSHFKIMGNMEQIPREELLATLVQGQLGLEVYLADAFPRTLLDYFSFGVPMITSDAMTFLNEDPILYENLVVQNPNDISAIYQKALGLLEDQEKWEIVSAACINFTKVYSFQAESDVLIKLSGIKIPEGKKIPQLDSSHLFFDGNESLEKEA